MKILPWLVSVTDMSQIYKLANLLFNMFWAYRLTNRQIITDWITLLCVCGSGHMNATTNTQCRNFRWCTCIVNGLRVCNYCHCCVSCMWACGWHHVCNSSRHYSALISCITIDLCCVHRTRWKVWCNRLLTKLGKLTPLFSDTFFFPQNTPLGTSSCRRQMGNALGSQG